MSTKIDQKRITLKNLKVADFASEETLCFSAAVLLDGEVIADANNSGKGGMTSILARKGKDSKVTEAETFAKTLPAIIQEYESPAGGKNQITLEITLDFLIDMLAAELYTERELKKSFRRSMSSKLLFIKNGELLYFRGVSPRLIRDRPAYFEKLRAQQGEPITILAELPTDEAFDIWKKHVTRKDS